MSVLAFAVANANAQTSNDTAMIIADKNSGIFVNAFPVNSLGQTMNSYKKNFNYDTSYVPSGHPVELYFAANCRSFVDSIYLNHRLLNTPQLDSIQSDKDIRKFPGQLVKFIGKMAYALYLPNITGTTHISGTTKPNFENWDNCYEWSFDIGPHMIAELPLFINQINDNGIPSYWHEGLSGFDYIHFKLDSGYMLDSAYVRNARSPYAPKTGPWTGRDSLFVARADTPSIYSLDTRFISTKRFAPFDTVVLRTRPKDYAQVTVQAIDLDQEYSQIEAMYAFFFSGRSFKYGTMPLGAFDEAPLSTAPLPLQVEWKPTADTARLKLLFANISKRNWILLKSTDTLKAIRIGWPDTAGARNPLTPLSYMENIYNGWISKPDPNVRYEDNRCLLAAYQGTRLLRRWSMNPQDTCVSDTSWITLNSTAGTGDFPIQILTKSRRPFLSLGGWNPYLGDSALSYFKKRRSSANETFYFTQMDSVPWPAGAIIPPNLKKVYQTTAYEFCQLWDKGSNQETWNQWPANDSIGTGIYNDSIAWKFQPGPNRTLLRTGLARKCWDPADPLNTQVSDTLWIKAQDSVMARFDSASASLNIDGFGTVDYSRCSNLAVVFDARTPQTTGTDVAISRGSAWNIRSNGHEITVTHPREYAVQWYDVHGRLLTSSKFLIGTQNFKVPPGNAILRIQEKNGPSRSYPWFGSW